MKSLLILFLAFNIAAGDEHHQLVARQVKSTTKQASPQTATTDENDDDAYDGANGGDGGKPLSKGKKAAIAVSLTLVVLAGGIYLVGKCNGGRYEQVVYNFEMGDGAEPRTRTHTNNEAAEVDASYAGYD
eukprot:m.12208 g.12208  ORF g.12208 m.12208 type:complete len:130 (-) comp4611_c0_seq2:67-456(-)